MKKTESLKKISFLAHSLGGLIARYAIAVLYTADGSKFQSLSSSSKGLIAGLEAINFITLATPHLGVRGNKQVGYFYFHSFFFLNMGKLCLANTNHVLVVNLVTILSRVIKKLHCILGTLYLTSSSSFID